jgi:uncharacterized protein YndB with AHSA1/START domain
MTPPRITVQAHVDAPIATAWTAYTAPEHVMRWNFASPDWHCPSASTDLRPGGRFTARMEARDGSAGFDFDGTYTQVIDHSRIDYVFANRQVTVEFQPDGDRILVRVAFEPEDEFPHEMQRDGWQAILDTYARHASSL